MYTPVTVCICIKCNIRKLTAVVIHYYGHNYIILYNACLTQEYTMVLILKESHSVCNTVNIQCYGHFYFLYNISHMVHKLVTNMTTTL